MVSGLSLWKPRTQTQWNATGSESPTASVASRRRRSHSHSRLVCAQAEHLGQLDPQGRLSDQQHRYNEREGALPTRRGLKAVEHEVPSGRFMDHAVGPDCRRCRGATGKSPQRRLPWCVHSSPAADGSDSGTSFAADGSDSSTSLASMSRSSSPSRSSSSPSVTVAAASIARSS